MGPDQSGEALRAAEKIGQWMQSTLGTDALTFEQFQSIADIIDRETAPALLAYLVGCLVFGGPERLAEAKESAERWVVNRIMDDDALTEDEKAKMIARLERCQWR